MKQTLNFFNRFMVLLVAMLTLGVTQVWGQTYTFTSKSWADSNKGWTSDKDGYQYSSPNVQITAAYTGAGATSKTSYTNITKISIKASTTSKGVGNITVKVGDGAAQTICTLSKSTTAKDYSIEYSTPVSGNVTFVVNCSTNSMYVQSITITAASGYDITYECNEATSGCPEKATDQTALPDPLPTGVQKTGFDFAGWFTNEGLTTAAEAGAEISANTTLYAKWEPATTPSIVSDPTSKDFGSINQGAEATAQEFTITGANLTDAIEATLSNTQFEFDGTPSLTATGGTVFVKPVTTTAGDLSANLHLASGSTEIDVPLTATIASVYTITWKANGTTFTTTQVVSGSTLVLPTSDPDPSTYCDGKTFMGWTATENYSDPSTPPTYAKAGDAVSADQTFYAVFATKEGSGYKWTKTAASAVTAGTYAIITTDGHAFNGTISSGHGQVTSSAFAFTDNVATSAPEGTLEVTIAASGNGYTMYNKDNGYLYASAASSGKLAWHTTESSYWSYKSSNWTYNSNSAYLRSYSNSSIRTYSANNGDVLQFAKKENNATYSDFVTTCVPTAAKPTLTEGAAFYAATMDVTITNNESGATVYYTTDGENPTTSSSSFTGASQTIQISATTTVKAMAVIAEKENSSVASATYTCRYYASLEDLVAADLTSGTTVGVSFSNVPIKSIVTNYKSERVGVYFDIQKEDKDIEIYCAGVPEAWVAGGKLSKSNLTCAWKRYPETGTLTCWELTPSSWDGFTYTAPTHITSIVISGEPNKKSYTDGQTLEPAGLVVTGYYDDHTAEIPHSEEITEGLTWTLPTLSEKQTSAEVTVKYTEPILSTELNSDAYEVTGLSVSAAKILQSIYVAEDSEHETKFFVGRPFSSAGLKVMAKYNIGDDEPITPTSISTPTMTSEGEQTVTITYTEKTVEKQTSYSITLTYMDLDDLVAATDINDGDYVYVKFTDQRIKDFYTSKGSNKGIYFDIQKEENDIEIYASGTACPSTWEVNGTVSATLNNVQWTKYNDTWELKPSNWDAFSYNAPNVPVQSITIDPAAVSVGETKTTQLSVIYDPTYATNKGVTWAVTEGSDKASVDADGLVTGKLAGSATITATLTADPSITATCAVTVTPTAQCTISYVVSGEQASTQTIARSEESELTYVPAPVSGHTFVGWAESDVTTATATPVTVISKYTPGAEEANKTLYAVYKYEDTSVEGYGSYNKITSAPADWSGKYLFVSETGNCAVKGSAIASSSLSHTPVTISEGVIAADDALLPEVLEVKKGTTNYTIKGGNGMYFTYNSTSNGFSAATTGAIEYPIAYDGTNKKTVITCPTTGGIPFQVNEQKSGDNKYYTFKFYATSQKAVQLYKLVEGTFYYTSYPSVKYTITFNADGGTGACAKMVVNAGDNATICEDAPTKDLNKFNNWSDGTNTYAPGATIENVNADITLTAQWIAKVQYTITFDKNGAEGTTPDAITDYEGNEVTLPTKGDLSYTGYTFKGWNDGTATYKGGSKFTMPETNVTMTAVWQDASVTHWALVINEKQLKAGDKVIIVAANYDKALAAQYETKYRSVVDITKSTDKYYVTESENEPTELIIGITDDKITFHDGNGYLYASSTSANEMNVQEVLDDNGKWNVSVLNGVATIESVGNTVKPLMQYNASNPRVACYGGEQAAGVLAIYKYYETLPEYVERAMPSALGTNCIAKGGVEEYAFSGATFFEILSKDGNDKNVTLQEVTSLIAGMPYIIQPVEGADKVLMMVGGDEASAQSSNGLYGWLTDDFTFDSQIDSKDVYFVNGGKIRRCGNNCTIVKNRAYIVLDEIGQDQTPAPGRRTLTLGVESPLTPTGLDLVGETKLGEPLKFIRHNQLVIIRNGQMYNAAGQLIQ